MMFFLKMTGLAILMILGFAGVVISLAFYFVPTGPDSSSLLLLGTGLASAAVTVICLRIFINFNRRWKAEFIEKFKTEPDRILGKWIIPLEQWKALAEYEGRESQNLAAWLGGGAGLAAGGLTVAILRGSADLGLALLGGIAVALLLGYGVCLMASAYCRKVTMAKLAMTEAEVAIRPDGMLINRERLVYWDMFGVSLGSVNLQTSAELPFPMLAIETRQYNGSNTSSTFHRIPVPSDQMEHARGIVNLFGKLV